MTNTFKWILACTAMGALCLMSAGSLSAQIQYASGQNVVPVFEGWERNADGSFNMTFGYMNRNYEEQVDIPVGPGNFLTPGNPDQGQPAHFYRRRQQYVFTVKVPNDWGQKDLVWTLTFRGRTEKAYGTLKPVWEIDNLVYQENRGGPGDMTYPGEANQPPSIEMVGSTQRTITLPEKLTLTVGVADDGHPVPRRGRSGAPVAVARDSDGAVIATGAGRGGGRGETEVSPRAESPLTQAVVKLDPGVRLGVTWVLYRGPAAVTFDPMKVPVISGARPGSPIAVGSFEGKATTEVTFSEPGNYRLRAYADDGVRVAPIDVNVTVQAARQ